MVRCPLRLGEAIPAAADRHSRSQLEQKSWCSLTPFGIGGQEGQTSYLLYLFVDKYLGTKKAQGSIWNELRLFHSQGRNKLILLAGSEWFFFPFPAQTTFLKETSWSKGFNEFSTPYCIPWICIIWTIFLEVIFQSGAQHVICMNACAWVIHTSKLWMYKRGPGIWTKQCSIFLLFPVVYPGKVKVSFIQEKITELFSSSLGAKSS